MIAKTDRIKETLMEWKPSWVLETKDGFEEVRVVGKATADSRLGAFVRQGDELFLFENSKKEQFWVKNPICFRISKEQTDFTTTWLNN